MTQHAAITRMINSAMEGDPGAANELFEAVYGELRQIASAQRRRWQGNETMNTTALIHEAFVKMAGGEAASWKNRTHFYATASRAMRHILVSYAKRQRAGKRGGGAQHVSIDDVLVPDDAAAEEALALDQALQLLEASSPRRCRVVECRFFGGMSNEETAAALGMSVSTVKREWKLASAWLYQRLEGESPAGPGHGRT